LPRSSSTPDEETLGGLAHLRIGEDDLFLVELRIHPSPGYLEPQLNQGLAGFLDLLCGRHELLVVHPVFHQFSLPFIEQRPPRSLAPACWWRRREPCFRIAARLFHQSANRCSGDAVLLRHLRSDMPERPVMNHLLSVHIERRTSDLPTFEPCPAHACPNSFYDEAAFKLSHGAHRKQLCALPYGRAISRSRHTAHNALPCRSRRRGPQSSENAQTSLIMYARFKGPPARGNQREP